MRVRSRVKAEDPAKREGRNWTGESWKLREEVIQGRKS